MKKSKNAVTFAGIALALDIIVFIMVSMAVVETTNFLMVLFLAILIYILAYDAFNAAVFIAEYFKNKQ